MRNDELALTESALSAVVAMDREGLIEYLGKLDVLKHALEVADEFNAKSVEFAKLEALALIRVCELGGQSSLHGHRRKAAEWLFAMRDDARAEALGMCSDGLTIEQVWKREVKDKERSDNSLALVKMYEKDVVAEFRGTGMVRLDRYDRHVEELQLASDVRKALKDNLRNKIRSLGGHGLGDGSGTYVTAEKAAVDFDEIVYNKVASMTRDLKRLQEICKSEGRVPTFDFGQAYSLDNPRILCLVIVCVMGLGKPVFKTHDQAVALINNMCARLGIDYGLLSKEDFNYFEKLKAEQDRRTADLMGEILRGDTEVA